METKPNIIWISFEDCLPLYGCYGDNVARTPNVDRLASEGCIYPNAFSTAPICAPARAGVITGMYPTSIGAHNMRISQTGPTAPVRENQYDAPVPHFVKCLGEYFRREGYYCSNNVKTDYQFSLPFAAWDDCSSGAHWRDRPDPSMPFFAVFNPEYTHESGMWEEMRSRPVMVEPEPAFEAITDPDSVEVPPYFPDTPRVRKSIAKNYDNIALCDKVMGQLLEQLEEDGLADNTIVVHWSDHGPMPRGKRHLYDSGIHSPMIVRWPGAIEPGTTSDRLVSTVDLGATMLSACGITVPPHMQGKAFLGKQESSERQYTYASVDRSDMDNEMVRAVRDKRYKYIKNGFPERPYLVWNRFRNNHPIMQEWYRCWLEGTLNETQSIMFADKRPVEELYDTDADPWEVHNLAEDDDHSEGASPHARGTRILAKGNRRSGLGRGKGDQTHPLSRREKNRSAKKQTAWFSRRSLMARSGLPMHSVSPSNTACSCSAGFRGPASHTLWTTVRKLFGGCTQHPLVFPLVIIA